MNDYIVYNLGVLQQALRDIIEINDNTGLSARDKTTQLNRAIQRSKGHLARDPLREYLVDPVFAPAHP